MHFPAIGHGKIVHGMRVLQNQKNFPESIISAKWHTILSFEIGFVLDLWSEIFAHDLQLFQSNWKRTIFSIKIHQM